MTQTAYAAFDWLEGAWVRSTGAGTHSSHIDDLGNSDYLSYGGAGETAGRWGIGLQSPLAGMVTITVQWKATGTFGRDLRVTLYEDPGSSPVARTAEWDVPLSSLDTWEFHHYALSTAERESINDWSDLAVETKVKSTGVAGTAFVATVRMQAPDPGFAHLDADLTSGGLVVVGAGAGNHLLRDGGGYRRVAGDEGSGSLILDANGNVVEHA